MVKEYRLQLGDNELRVEIGGVAQLANGACLLRCRDTVVLVTATNSSKPRDGIDFFPLSVDYEEKLYAAGKIPGGFIKREGRPSERSILTSRLIDRPIRPLFPKGYRNDVQVVATVLSMDQDANPDTIAMIGSSIALSISSIPFDGPTGSVSVGLVEGELVLNPTLQQRNQSSMYLVVSGTADAIMMVEASSHEVEEATMLKAILFAHAHIKKIVAFIEMIQQDTGKPKMDVELFTIEDEVKEAVLAYGAEKMRQAILTEEKMARIANMDAVKADIKEYFAERFPEKGKQIEEMIYTLTKQGVRDLIVHNGVRPDNRATEEIRPISCEVGLLPRPHGSGLFTRGQTQVMSIATLAALGEAQTLDGLSEEEEKRYMHHYNFPSFSVGEARPSRGPGRREIGHGALAERALEPMLPDKESFPYAIRVVSEVLASNGSSSQASVCGSTLSLLDAGVPLKSMVAGIAMGLIKEEEKVAILSDIQGMEDFLGDMDFKVAGTDQGITAIQMDIKIKGIDEEILTRALEQARQGRLFILGEMRKVIAQPRPELSRYAPLITTLHIHPDKIRDVIGAGGKVINKIIEETGGDVKIDIEQDGTVYIAAVDRMMGQKAQQMIENIVKDAEVGLAYQGKVTRLMAFGAFVEILPGKEGLLHISQYDTKRVDKIEDVLKVGDEVDVLLTEVDSQGRLNLSRKALLMKQDPSLVDENAGTERRGPRPGGDRRPGGSRPPYRREGQGGTGSRSSVGESAAQPAPSKELQDPSLAAPKAPVSSTRDLSETAAPPEKEW